MIDIIDFHSHILPEMDDGSDCMDTSLKMMKMAASQGIRHMVATPHFYPHRESLEVFLQRRNDAERKLRSSLMGQKDYPELSVGAEVFYFRGMCESDMIQMLTLGNTPYIMIEMPFVRWTDHMYRDLEKIWEIQGITPIIAHVERYFSKFSTHRIPEHLAQLPVLVQSNAEFFLNSKTSARAIRLLMQNRIHLLGSDCHNLNLRKPNLGDAVAVIENKLGTKALDQIRLNGRTILAERYSTGSQT